MADYDPDLRTRQLARIAGPFLVVAAITILMRYGALHLLMPAYASDAPLVLATGAFTLMAGLTMLAFHHHWTSAPAIALTLLSILVTLRGVALMVMPALATRYAGLIADMPVIALIGAVIILLIGLWLSFVGWFAGSRQNS